MGKHFTEQTTVQDPLVRYASKVGWGVLPQEEQLVLRQGEAGLFLYQTLRDQLIALNSGVVTVVNVDEIVKRIENARGSIEGNEDVLLWLRGRRSVYLDSERREVNVVLLDFETPGNNVFNVTPEWQYTNGTYTNRADVMFLINGIPVAIVETKSAKKRDGIDRGLTQIRRYHRETPELLTAPQIFDITHLVNFYYGATWNLDRRNLINWKDQEPGNFEKKVTRFFDRDRMLRVLRDYIAFIRKDEELSKLILRQHQVRAVEKVVDRAQEAGKRRGLVWHTQGSGKTLTMITAAHQMLTRPEFEKPTVLMLVDRNELEAHLFGNLQAYGITEVEVASSKTHLRKLLKSGFRGLIVSMIHKFDKLDKDSNTGDRVIVLVDEAHRSIGGDLGNYLVGALPNATIIGFTGTPIDRTAHGKGTFKVFGGEDEKGYLDKYSIVESIADGTTLPLRYSLAPNEMQVPRERLEREFLDLAEAEGVSDIEDLNRILDRAVSLKAFLKSEDRVEKVAKYVADHFKANVEPMGYKAFLVGVDREACALYKEALDKYLPADYSEVVYTSPHNDREALAKHRLDENAEKQLRLRFVKPGTRPQILIVTEKLLTGFDAPILYCMYLDKPMRDHTLLQAIARVNRPHGGEDGAKKPSGFVLDFVGIFDNLEKALAFDSDVVAGVVENIDVLKERFRKLMEGDAQLYLDLAVGERDDKLVERIQDYFINPDKQEAFRKLFKELETLYEIISPDTFLRDFLEAYGTLAEVYSLMLAALSADQPVGLGDLMKKTEELVRSQVSASGLVAALPVYEINEKTLEALKKETSSESSRIVNLARSLASKVREQADNQPHLIPIADRAAHILTLFEDRQLTTQQALAKLQESLDEYLSAQRELKERGFDIETFSVYWVLRRKGVEEEGAEKMAPEIRRAIKNYPEFRENSEERRDLTADIYKILLPQASKASRAPLVQEILRVAAR